MMSDKQRLFPFGGVAKLLSGVPQWVLDFDKGPGAAADGCRVLVTDHTGGTIINRKCIRHALITKGNAQVILSQYCMTLE